MNNPRRPFWIYASSYYIFAIAISIAVFFLIWGILLGNDSEAPWIPAGLLASLVIISAVVLREFILRRLSRQSLFAQKQVDHNLNAIYSRKHHGRNQQALKGISLEKNASFIEQISRKSKAARTLGRIPEAHLEVFEMCNEYLHINSKELEKVGLGATKLAAFRRSREKIQSFHKYHLLSWASIESNLLIQDAKIHTAMSEKLENAQRALNVLDSAVRYYPNEKQIIDSIEAVKEFIASIKVSHWMEQAERSAFKGNYKRAINHYRDALFFLGRESTRTADRDSIAEKINSEIENLRELLKNGNNEEKLPPRTKNNEV